MRGRALTMLVLSAVVGSCKADGNDKGYVVLPGMVDSYAYDAYSTHPVIGQTLRHPPEGTLPYGATRYRYGPGKAEALRAGRELHNPVALDEEALTRGKAAWGAFCAVCHGAGANGDGPVIGRGITNPPDLTMGPKRDLPAGHVFHVITYGHGLMPAHAVQVPPGDRWRIVHYLRDLQGHESASTTPPAQKGATP